MSEIYPHVILENLTTPLGKWIGDVLKHLFPVPKANSKRIVTFANRGAICSVLVDVTWN